MAYDDGYYFGLAKVIVLASATSDNGKTVTVTNGTKTYTGTMADGKCAFKIPGNDAYTIRIGSSSCDVDISYGECAEVYVPGGKKDIAEIKTQIAGDLSDINTKLGGMKFGIDANGNYGYIKAGADSVTPFNTCYYVGTGTSFNIKTLFPTLWNKVTINNFLIGFGSGTYNTSTGVLTVTNNTVSGSVTATVGAGTNATITETYHDSGTNSDIPIDRSGPLKNSLTASGSYSRTISPKVYMVTHPI